MAENVRKPLLLLLGLIILALPLSVSAQIAETQNRRILDISLITYKDNYRIKIRLEKPMQAVISDPREGEPLRVQFRGARIEPGFQPKPASNQLVSRVWMDSSDAGLVSLEFQLATHQVSVTHFSLTTPEPMLIIDLKLKSGAEIPPASAPKNESSPSTPKATAAGSPAPISELPTTHTSPTSPAIPDTPVVPNADTKPGFFIPGDSEDTTETEPISEPTPASHIMPPALPSSDLADIAVPPVSAALPPAVAQATLKPIQPMKPASDEYDYFPLDELHLTFPGANEMLREYKANRFMAALKIGFPALTVAQPPKSSVLAALSPGRVPLPIGKRKRISSARPWGRLVHRAEFLSAGKAL